MSEKTDKTSEKQPGGRLFDMVVIGGTGDLSRRKLLPALYFLHKHGEFASNARIFAIAREQRSRESYLEMIEESSREHVGAEEVESEEWRRFIERLDYLPMSATDPASYAPLHERLGDDPERVRVFYLATSPDLYGDVSHALHTAGLVTPQTRIVLEKPIGSDLASAEAINSKVGEVFRERQIYRIDHYLGKETVQNLMALRFGNALFEPIWQREHVDHVQITVAETLGMEGRGPTYDKAGTLRDMIQNHLLQLLCLVAMEPPAQLEQDFIREEKIKVLRSLRPMSPEDVAKKIVRGQYQRGHVAGKEVVAYREEEGVPKDSLTETFVAIKAEVENWRWAGVPFYLRTGKRMSHRVSEIILVFKPVPHLLFKDQAKNMHPNRLVIRLQPDESIKLSMMTKVPGVKMVLRREHLNLNLGSTHEKRTPQAYERLLLDVIRGVATLFIHRQEVEAAWRWVESILDEWKESGDHPRFYNAGTWGPTEAVELIVGDERRWYESLA